MGTKVNPVTLRIGTIRTWSSKWYAKGKEFTKLLHEDLKMRDFLESKLKETGLARVEILRSANSVTVNLYTAKPGNLIGREGSGVEQLRADLEKLSGSRCNINVKEVKKPNLEAKLVGEIIVQQLEKRISYRRAIKMSMDRVMEAGALGVKVYAGGRLNGVEISRSEYFNKGTVPLQTLRADIDYAYVPAHTRYGVIGVKVWIYRGLIFKKKTSEELMDQGTQS